MAKAESNRYSDLFSAFGPIALRCMFGGEGLFVNGTMIGLVMREQLYLKTDAASRAPYLAEGMKPFSFAKNGKLVETGYYAIPDRLYDDPEEFAGWARRAHKVALAKTSK